MIPAFRRPLLATLGLTGLLVLACARAPEVITPPYTPSYAFEVPNSQAGKGISIGIVSPQLTPAAQLAIMMSYAKVGIQPPITGGEDPAYLAFREAVGRGLLQYFTSSGFTVSGPFVSADVMTFPEKKQSDLLLTADFGVVVDEPKPALARGQDGSIASVTASGNCTVDGSIILVLWEPLSMQRMWTKTIAVAPATVDCTTSARSVESYRVSQGNALARSYEQIYANAMEAAVRYFDPEEVAMINGQARELREKKVY